MPDRSIPDPQVHLHWVRETPSRALELPFSATLSSLEALPPCVQAAVRATGLAAVELHLPPFRPSETPDLDAWLAGLTFRQDAVGRLIATASGDPDPLTTMAWHHAILLALRAVTGDATPLTLVAESAPAPVLPRPLASRHRCAALHGGLAKAPAERSRNYDRVYKQVSIALQSAIREWLPPAHVEGLGQFDDRQHLLSLLAWSCAEPVTGKSVDQLTVDVFSADSLRRATAGLPRRMARQMAGLREVLLRHHADPLICDSYKPEVAGRLARNYRRRTRFLFLLFSNEARLINSFVHFCSGIGHFLETAQGDPAGLYREIRDRWEAVESLLRRFYQRHSHSALGSLLLLEAVRTLEAVD